MCILNVAKSCTSWWKQAKLNTQHCIDAFTCWHTQLKLNIWKQKKKKKGTWSGYSPFHHPNRMVRQSATSWLHFPSRAPSVIEESKVGRFIKTVCAAWGTQRSLSGLEMAGYVYGRCIKNAPIITRACSVWTQQLIQWGDMGNHKTHTEHSHCLCTHIRANE